MGREIFALSSLIAAVPIVVVGTLSLIEVNRSFAGRTGEFLGETARSYGEVVYERLLLASELVRQTAESAGSVQEHPSEQLESVLLVDREGPADIVRRTLRIDASVTPAAIYILRPVGGQTAIGRVSPDYLWGDTADYPYSIDFACWRAAWSARCTAPRGSRRPPSGRLRACRASPASSTGTGRRRA